MNSDAVVFKVDQDDRLPDYLRSRGLRQTTRFGAFSKLDLIIKSAIYTFECSQKSLNASFLPVYFGRKIRVQRLGPGSLELLLYQILVLIVYLAHWL